jgi:hypothetical protein
MHTSVNHSRMLESAIPPSTIAALSAGEFVGMVMGDVQQKIELKAFHCALQNDQEVLKKEQELYQELPVIRKIDHGKAQRNYLQAKQDKQDIIHAEMERLLNNPALKHLIIKKGE